MKENIYDKVTTKIEQRLTRAMGKIDKQFKGVNPYGQVKVSDEEMIQRYNDFTPEMEQTAFDAGMPMEAINNYHLKMRDLIRRKGYA